ncbi:CAMK/CAMKL/AMPK protein kinase [Saprolegnia parasitica CBS 223.65]|uniref:non-specific serine/threonine protein kinase n=1 Tax=Saprolegnia parasitica (strain CBS 223.65) TaxID=695850 RepID=A0A067CW64_SAPPC|nr:CAMK/CAMKL/AMPK protein kinase [Saprolegnia parasitica CBS 223.65]KDO34713.1 CAMK/CAMKL/AMPK protein kinase [Saprolegnia parasitica CBS 223.65]|eukprot:XP_012194382.1 CAMK/CAMKL/AMPK protein kinase [Saprolegnia parasitica CBS 223.65]
MAVNPGPRRRPSAAAGATFKKKIKQPSVAERDRVLKALVANNSLELYQLGAVIGNGQFGQVRTGVHRLSQRRVALKVYSKSKAIVSDQIASIQKEIDIMKEIDHPNIVRLYEILETKDHITIIMEHCDGEDLGKYMARKTKLDEGAARVIFQQITDAIGYLHRKHIVHRDIKPQNILIQESAGRPPLVKLVDFGLGARDTTKAQQKLTAFCGTPAFMAPEIIAHELYEGKPVDAWSLGVLLYLLVTGSIPFDAPSPAQLYPKICRGVFEMPAHLSPSLVDLLRAVLTVDVNQRLCVEQMRHHQWLCVEEVVAKRTPVMIDSMTSLFVAEASTHRAILAEMTIYGLQKEAILDDLASKTYNGVTAWYRLLHLQALQTKRKQSALLAPSKTQALKKPDTVSNNAVLSSMDFARFLQEKMSIAKDAPTPAFAIKPSCSTTDL